MLVVALGVLLLAVMFCNTYVTIADKLQLVPSHSTHHCHFNMTSEIPRTSILHLCLAVINPDPVFHLVKVSLLVSSCLCIPVSQIPAHITLLCFISHFQYPQLILCSLIPYIRLLFPVCI